MLPRATTTKISPRDDNFIRGFGIARSDKLHGIESIRKADERKTPELFILFLDSGNEGKILSRNNLIGIDVILADEDGAGNGVGHKAILVAELWVR